MDDKKKLIELDDLVAELEISQERAQLVLGDLSQDYFDLQEDSFIRLYHDKAGVQCGIVLDYVFKIGELLNTARELLRRREVGV